MQKMLDQWINDCHVMTRAELILSNRSFKGKFFRAFDMWRTHHDVTGPYGGCFFFLKGIYHHQKGDFSKKNLEIQIQGGPEIHLNQLGTYWTESTVKDDHLQTEWFQGNDEKRTLELFFWTYPGFSNHLCMKQLLSYLFFWLGGRVHSFKTNISPWKFASPKRKLGIPSIDFQGDMLVPWRVHGSCCNPARLPKCRRPCRLVPFRRVEDLLVVFFFQ